MKGTSHQAMHTVKKLEDPDIHISILSGLGSRDYSFGGTESTHAAHLWHALPRFENGVANLTGKSIRTTHPLFGWLKIVVSSEEAFGCGFPFSEDSGVAAPATTGSARGVPRNSLGA